jgi:hypothetical protein
MMRGLLVAALATAAAFPTAAAAAVENTPDGPATLTTEGRLPGPMPATAALPPQVLMAWRITVAPGGRAGTVRPRFTSSDGRTVTGDPVVLPAEPGTYTFAAPRLYAAVAGIVQTEGGQAILNRETCQASPFEDPCETIRVVVKRDGQPDEWLPGAWLPLSGVYEDDTDQDLAGDATEDRTDLKIAAAPSRDADGTLRVAVTITNAGPRAADLPQIETPLPGARIEGCRPFSQSSPEWWLRIKQCVQSQSLAAGQSRTLAITAGANPDAVTTAVKVLAEGPDLNPADNSVPVGFPAEPAFTVTTGKSHELRRGVKVNVRGARAGRARVTVAFKVHGRTLKLAKVVALKPYVERTVAVRAGGAKLRSLRRALASGALSAEITVRTISGKTPVTASTKVRG